MNGYPCPFYARFPAADFRVTHYSLNQFAHHNLLFASDAGPFRPGYLLTGLMPTLSMASEYNVSVVPCHPNYIALALKGFSPGRKRHPSSGHATKQDLTPCPVLLLPSQKAASSTL